MLAQHWSIAVGVVVGLVLLPVVSTEWQAWRAETKMIAEQGTPVIRETAAVIVARDDESVTVRVTGEKVRDCRLIGLQAFSVHHSVMLPARMKRLGAELHPIPRPPGPFDMGDVTVWPVSTEAQALVLYALHTCGPQGIEVRSTLARVTLDER
jgi:hypothetical protein